MKKMRIKSSDTSFQKTLIRQAGIDERINKMTWFFLITLLMETMSNIQFLIENDSRRVNKKTLEKRVYSIARAFNTFAELKELSERVQQELVPISDGLVAFEVDKSVQSILINLLMEVTQCHSIANFDMYLNRECNLEIQIRNDMTRTITSAFNFLDLYCTFKKLFL